MRVTLVSPFDPEPSTSTAGGHVGGVERVFLNVSRSLARRGHRVTLVCSGDGPYREEQRLGVRVLRVPRQGILMRAPLAPLAAHVPEDSQLVHVAATYPFTTPAVLKRARRLAVPSVLDFHFEPRLESAAGRLAAFAYRRFGPPTYDLARLVLVRSHAYGLQAPSLANVPRERWRVVPNGVDPAVFHPDVSRPTDPYALFVGRLVPYKGVATLLHAMAIRPLGMPLLIAGEGPLRQPLEHLARALGVDARFLGRVEDESLPDLYRGARVTILPSVSSQEAFGISLVESMACGTPVVASALPGVEEIARQGGLLAVPRDPRSLADQLHRATHTDILPRGPALARRIHASYSWEAVTDRLVAAYQEAVTPSTTATIPAV